MKSEILSVLATVRRRQQWMSALRVLCFGLLGGAAAALVVGAVHFTMAVGRSAFGRWVHTDDVIPAEWGFGLLAAGALVGVLLALLRRGRWETAAIAVDGHYKLKDRTISALEFLESGGDPLRELQIDDAARHLHGVNARQVAPFRFTWEMPVAGLLVIVASVFLMWPSGVQPLEAATLEPLPGVLMAADEIKAGLEELEKAAEDTQDEELKELVEELQEDVEAMKLPGVELKEALETISEMQERMQQEQAQYNESLMDAQLQSLGGAMMAASDFQGAGSRLKEQDYEKAAEELEQLEQVNLQRREQRAMEEKLATLSATCEQLGLGQLADAMTTLGEGVSGGNNGKVREGTNRLARQVRRHQQRKVTQSLLRSQVNRLSECKGMCRNPRVGPQQLVNQQSKKPSESWGTSTTGNPYGDRNRIASMTNLQEITGQAGEGPSDIELTSSPEGQEQARRDYQEVFEQYQQMSQAVLDSEPIPLGHRQTIRNYFELIRPGVDELADQDEQHAAEQPTN